MIYHGWGYGILIFNFRDECGRSLEAWKFEKDEEALMWACG